MTPAEIDAEFKRRFHAGEPEAEISAWYKSEHEKLIQARKQAERLANVEPRYCELCGDEMPVRKGRAPKKCETCKDA